MKRLFMAAAFALGLVASVEAQEATVSQASINAIIERLNKLEAENKALSAKVADLENKNKALTTKVEVASSGTVASLAPGQIEIDEGTTTNETGRVFTTEDGHMYYLADVKARIFEPLSESGLKITPYAYLFFEGVYNSDNVATDWTTDFVNPRRGTRKGKTTTLSVQDSMLGASFETPEWHNGWKIDGKAEFDLAGADENDYGFHWRHLYVNATHESGWSILFGQTWHLWKIVTPNEIDGAWLEYTGHPYRRSPQIRVTRRWELDEEGRDVVEARVGLVKGGPGMGGDRDEDQIQDNSASCWGLFEGAVVWEHKAGWAGDNVMTLGIGGMYGRDRSHDASEWDSEGNPTAFRGNEHDYNSQMLLLAAQVPIFANVFNKEEGNGDKLTFTGQIFSGENLGGVQAGVGQRVGWRQWRERGDEVRTIGGFFDLAYDWNKTWGYAAGYGFDDPEDGDARGADGILSNDRAYLDIFYHINPQFYIAVEYAYLTTKWEGEGTADDHRWQFTAAYFF